MHSRQPCDDVSDREPGHQSGVSSELGIAAIAASRLRDNFTIFLDAGTTTGALVDAIVNLRDVTVVTNDFAIVDALLPAEHIETIHVGGRLDHANRSSVGRLAAETLRRINVDLGFISASSWDLERGITTPSEGKVDVKRAALDASAETILTVSSSKFGTFGMYDIAPLRRFDEIITDWHLPGAAAEGIHDAGIPLSIAVHQ